MRIAFVSTMDGSSWGGSEELWCLTARRAREAGHEVFASVYDHGVVPDQLAGLSSIGVRVDFRRRGIHRRIDEPMAVLRPRFRALTRFDPDILCISQGASYDLATFGDCEELRRWLGSSDAAVVLICQLNHDCSSLSDARREKARALFQRAARVAFVSERSRREARRHLATNLPNSVIVRNPVNLKSLDMAAWPPPSDEARWANVARLEVCYKGQDGLMEALSDRVWMARPWRVSLFGRGPDQAYLSDLAAYYGLTDRCVLRGHAQDVCSIWAEHEMLLLPSREEGTPLAMVEAMICGRPGLVTDVAGNPEWIKDDVSGFVAASPRAGALHNALERAWASRVRWPEMGSAARTTALGLMDPDPAGSFLRLLEDARASAGVGVAAHNSHK